MKVEKKPGKAAAKIRIEADGSYFQINQVCVIFLHYCVNYSGTVECIVKYLNSLQLFNASEGTKRLENVVSALSVLVFFHQSPTS